MPEIKKVTPELPYDPGHSVPVLCLPKVCLPATIHCLPSHVCGPFPHLAKQSVSGCYRSPATVLKGILLELRVDVDGRRPENRISGDYFHCTTVFVQFPYPHTVHSVTYDQSFVVDTPTITINDTQAVITGAIRYYSNPGIVTDTIEVTIPRVSLFTAPADATANIYTAGTLTKSYVCSKQSEYFRTAQLDLDTYQGVTLAATADTSQSPHPADLPAENLSIPEIFQRAGIDLKVNAGETITDPDPDLGNEWSEGELHNLMEAHFEAYGSTPSWNVWGAVVPRFQSGSGYDPGYYGVMFDWGGYPNGDSTYRFGFAIAHDAIEGRTSGTLYDTTAKRDRLMIETFAHEAGHAFNLPHTWQRSLHADGASHSFMNYPWRYPAGESAWWGDFRWEFDDAELIWMRHANRDDVMFGGHDWIGNNLSVFRPDSATPEAPVELAIATQGLYEMGEPVRVQITLTNTSDQPQAISPHLAPEDGWIEFYARRPNGEFVRYLPPACRMKTAEPVALAAGQSIQDSAVLSYSSTGFQFAQPGEYVLRAAMSLPGGFRIVSKVLRLRVMAPRQRSGEELADLMFRPEAAKLFYFGAMEGHARYLSALNEAVMKHTQTEPVLARHIRAALGTNAAARFKHSITRGEKRVLVQRKPDLKSAALHLEAALEPVRETGRAIFDPITFERVSAALVENYLRQGNEGSATKAMKQALAYLESQPGAAAQAAELRKRVDSVTRVLLAR